MLFASVDMAFALIPLARDFIGNWPLVRYGNLTLRLACIVAHLWWFVKHNKPDATQEAALHSPD